MSIIHYTDNDINTQIKIKGEYSYECNQKYHNNNSNKKNYRWIWTFSEKSFNIYDKQEIYNRKEFINIT